MIKIKDLEIRFSWINNQYELVKYRDENSCFTIAIFEEDSEDYSLKTIGSRFFEDPNAWYMGKLGLSILNGIKETKEEISENEK